MNTLAVVNDPAPVSAPVDGFADTAAEAADNYIRGTLLLFADWHWTAGTERLEVPSGTKLIVLDIKAGWVQWRDGKPVRHIMREPGARMLDDDELPDNDPATWEIGPDGNPKPRWSNTRYMYSAAPETFELFTYSTSSWGGRNAVIGLADQVNRMRVMKPGACPIVELGAASMLTKFGRKSKPVLKITDWLLFNKAPAEIPPPKASIVNDMLNDEVPFK